MTKEKKYRPFMNFEELVRTFEARVCKSPCKRPRFTMPIIWVRYKESNTIQMITSYSGNGVEMGGEFMEWESIYNKLLFLDNSPCGVEL